MAQGRPDYYKSNIIMGKHNSAFLPVLLDAKGTILARLQAPYEGTLKDVLMDSSGTLYVRIQGKHTTGQKDILVNESGNLLTEIQGKDGEELRTVYVDGEGKLVVKTQAVGGGINPLYFIDDGGDTNIIADWIEGEMALDPVDAGAFGAEGVKSMKLGIDGELPGYPSAWWKKSIDLGNLSVYQYKHIYLRFWIETLEFFSSASWSVTYEIGTDNVNLIGFEWAKSELVQGWNVLKMNIQQTDYVAGTINWTDIQYQNFSLKISDINEDVFHVIIDYIAFVELNPNKDSLMNIKTDESGILLSKISGNYAGFAKPIAVDIDGNLAINMNKQDLWTLVANKYKGYLVSIYEHTHHTTTGSSILSNISSPGIIMGGFIWHEGAESHRTCEVSVTLDGVLLNKLTFQEMNQQKIKDEWTWIPHLDLYDNTLFHYKVNFPKGIVFKENWLVSLEEKIDAESDTYISLYYALI